MPLKNLWRRIRTGFSVRILRKASRSDDLDGFCQAFEREKRVIGREHLKNAYDQRLTVWPADKPSPE
jgi:hypothetical protein